MKLNKPKFWETKNNFVYFILYPLSLIFLAFVSIKKKIIKPLKFNIPIICVGNIYLGGTGKTPVSIFIANELKTLGKRPVIIRKFYQSHKDEHKLIKANFESLILNKIRKFGIYEAEKNNHDVAILDDGFQDYSIEKNFSILCFNSNQLIGNGSVFPSGPLRESLSSLQNAQIVLINGKKKKEFEEKILKINKSLKIFYSNYKPLNIEKFMNKRLLVIAGIANPDNFFKLIEENNLNVIEKLVFPDHYEFSVNEIMNIIEKAKSKNLQIIMTEKDYFKISHFNLDQLEYLKVSLEIEGKDEFLKILNKSYV